MAIRSNKPLPFTAAFTANRHIHDNRALVINAAAGIAVTLQAATGSGARYKFILGTAITSNSTTVTRAGSDVMHGFAVVEDSGDSTASDATVFPATSATIFTFPNGAAAGNFVEVQDVASGVWSVIGYLSGQTDPATPFS
jgi:hypothetical protein